MDPGGGWSWAYNALASITASSRLCKIIIVGYLDTTTHELFDAQLSALPISPTIEFEIHPPYYASMIASLPQLMSKNMVRRVSTCGRSSSYVPKPSFTTPKKDQNGSA
jgi:hypothetical protein